MIGKPIGKKEKQRKNGLTKIKKRGKKIMMNYTIEKYTDTLTRIHVTEPNQKGETLCFEITECTNPGGKNALPYLWHKAGLTDKVLETYLCIDTYCKDTEGNCFRMYNPQSKRSEDGKRSEINFDWMFENTEENKQKLINEIIRLFESATGKSVTQEKMERCEKYASENGIEIVTEKPEGWRELLGISSPVGSVVITNRKSIKQKDYKKALLIY